MKTLLAKYNFIVIFILLALVPLFAYHEPFYLHLTIMFMLYASLGQALNIISGYGGQLSLGHAAFFGVGAYTSTLLFINYNITPWFGMVIGGIFSAVLAIIIGYPCFRLRGPFFVLSTIAFGEIMRMLAIYFKGITKGAVGVPIPLKFGLSYFVFRSKLPYFYVALILFIFVMAVSRLISKSKLGTNLNALRGDEDTALTVGINVQWSKLEAMIISAFFTGMLGTFHAQYVLFIEPASEFSLDLSIIIAMILVLGGIGKVWGPVVGAAVIIPLEEFTRGWLGGSFQGLHFVIYGITLMIIAMIMPEGIVGRGLEVLRDLIPRGKERLDETPIRPIVKSYTPKSLKQNGYLLSVNNLWKHFGGVAAVKGVDFGINEGEISAIIGPNGAGKSTIFNLISGFHKPDRGEIFLSKENITYLPPAKRAHRGLGRTFQIVKPFHGLSVFDNVVIGAFKSHNNLQEAGNYAMDILHLTQLLDKKDFKISELTIGDQKKLELGRALATQPKLLMLDEVMAGLHPKETQEMVNLINQIRGFGVTVLLIEHVMSVVMQLSDKIIVLDQGEKISEGTPREIAKDERTIKAYLGKNYEIT